VRLDLFGMPLGVAGLAGCWAAAESALALPAWPAEALFAASTALWGVLTVLYLIQGIRTTGTFQGHLRHPFSGPLAAYPPLIGILLASHYSTYLTDAGRAATLVCIVLLGIVSAQLVAHWLRGSVPLGAAHPGYFIPVVAGANVASIGFSTAGLHDAALAAFGAGLFFWPVISALVLVRLMVAGALPRGLTPALTAFVAAAATSNLAWMIAHPGPIGDVQTILIGVLVVMLAVQVALLGEYRRLRFSPSWWTFTFPLASTADFAIRWSMTGRMPGWEVVIWAVLAAVSAFVLYVAVRTITGTISRLRLRRRDPLSGPTGAPRGAG
jgi:tellurite resistance protein